jgi:hypothetical protein
MRSTTAAGASGVAARGGALPEDMRRPTRSRSREARARRVRGFVACVIFAAMLGIGWVMGVGHPPPKEQVVEEPAPKLPGKQSAGWIVQELPGGEQCNYTLFDNLTQEVGEPATNVCPTKGRGNPWQGYTWGRN